MSSYSTRPKRGPIEAPTQDKFLRLVCHCIPRVLSVAPLKLYFWSALNNWGKMYSTRPKRGPIEAFWSTFWPDLRQGIPRVLSVAPLRQHRQGCRCHVRPGIPRLLSVASFKRLFFKTSGPFSLCLRASVVNPLFPSPACVFAFQFPSVPPSLGGQSPLPKVQIAPDPSS